MKSLQASASHLSVERCCFLLLEQPTFGVQQMRLRDAVSARKLTSELISQTLHEVDLAWNNLLSFLVFGHSAFQALLLPPRPVSEPCVRLAKSELNHVCGICLTEINQEPQVPSGNLDPVLHQGLFYH
ncbi:hypothetical protein E2320_012523, partial [Naja naja]